MMPLPSDPRTGFRNTTGYRPHMVFSVAALLSKCDSGRTRLSDETDFKASNTSFLSRNFSLKVWVP
ncbi:hypothetical protein D1872_292250 [compost metagenome]